MRHTGSAKKVTSKTVIRFAREGMELERCSVGSLESIFYIPSFLSTSEQDYLTHKVNNVPVSKWKSLKNRRLQNWGGVVHEKGLIAQSLPLWLTTLTQRISSETGLFPSPINHVLVNEYKPGEGIMPHQDGPLYFPVVAIVSLGSPIVIRFSPHQGIKQEAPAGTTGEEKDSEAHQTNALDGENLRCDKSIRPRDVSLILMPGSLLLFKDAAYADYLHGIEDTDEHMLDDTVVNYPIVKNEGCAKQSLSSGEHDVLDTEQPFTLRRTGTRISLTCRLISKVQSKFLRL